MPRVNEAGYAPVRKVRIPQFPPVLCASSIFLCISFSAQTRGKHCNFVVVCRVLHLLRTGPINAFYRNVAESFPVLEPTSPFLELVSRRILSVINFGPV